MLLFVYYQLVPVLDELKEQEADLTELDFSDDHQSPVTACVSVIGNESFNRSGESGENILSVNFKSQQIELPKFVGDLLAIDLTVKAKKRPICSIRNKRGENG